MSRPGSGAGPRWDIDQNSVDDFEDLFKSYGLVKEEIKEEPKEQKQTFKSENSEIQKVFIHCLPAVIKEKKDSLYGESYKTIKYSEPISFEGVILNQEDLFIQIWTDTDLVGVRSILYPRTNSKNWWRVQEKEEKKNGWLLTGILSDYQPSFINS